MLMYFLYYSYYIFGFIFLMRVSLMMTADDGEGSNALEICCACILDGVD